MCGRSGATSIPQQGGGLSLKAARGSVSDSPFWRSGELLGGENFLL